MILVLGATNLELTAVGDDDGLGGLSGLGADGLDVLDDIEALHNGAKDAVLAIKPLGLDSAQEELGSVGVGTSVGHGEDTRSSVLEGEVLVGELVAVDGLTTSSVAGREVTTLAHEGGNDTVEGGALEVQGLSGLSGTLLASAEGAEVLGGLGDHVGAELHDDAAGVGAANGHVEENLRVGHLDGGGGC